MNFSGGIAVAWASALCLGACSQSPEIKAAAMRDDDDTCRAMTFQPGTEAYQACRLTAWQNRETRGAERRAAFSQTLNQMSNSIQPTDAYSHLGHSDRLQTTCNYFGNTVTCQ